MDNKILESLRDIHQPAEIPWWPIAPGWWLLIVLLLVVIFYAWRSLWPRWIRHRKLQMWQTTLAKLQRQAQNPKRTHRALMITSKLLRKLAHQRYPEKAAGQLLGRDWLDFLNESGQTKAFTNKVGMALVIGPYNPHIRLNQQEREQLFMCINTWVEKHV